MGLHGFVGAARVPFLAANIGYRGSPAGAGPPLPGPPAFFISPSSDSHDP